MTPEGLNSSVDALLLLIGFGSWEVVLSSPARVVGGVSSRSWGSWAARDVPRHNTPRLDFLLLGLLRALLRHGSHQATLLRDNQLKTEAQRFTHIPALYSNISMLCSVITGKRKWMLAYTRLRTQTWRPFEGRTSCTIPEDAIISNRMTNCCLVLISDHLAITIHNSWAVRKCSAYNSGNTLFIYCLDLKVETNLQWYPAFDAFCFFCPSTRSFGCAAIIST